MTSLKIVIFPTRGIVLPYILEDICNALIQLGHKVATFPLTATNQFDYNLTKNFFNTHKPDYVFMLGTNGIIETSSGNHFLEEIKMPYVSLNFDFPFSLIKYPKEKLKHLKTTFIWDKEYIDILKQSGLTNTHYLPLGTNPSRFTPQKTTQEINEISFVGTISSTKQILDIQNLLTKEQIELTETIIRSYLKDTSQNLLSQVMSELSITDNYFGTIYELADTKINNLLRKKAISKICNEYPITVYGNKAWEEMHNNKLTLHPPIAYKNLNSVYADTKINLNITTPQLATTVNQRIFDGGAGQNFILTDYRAGLKEYFDEDEVVFYSDLTEMIDKIEYYLNHDDQRNKISQKAYNRITKEHTWLHRMQDAMEILEQS